ncbi:putative membrane protein [Pullulanibacillus pueri]|uniref:Cytochrome c oxidase assembly factor CtaG n=1 Tax=Pullulanibacillus pueri TaxID=1437324 RepID=A0A8J3EL34_9BACL|nr:cytochrome c oxidase assembly protein [Pullulanibacillus pueri]MBM7681183.1 putative membrane protein [Pullulanibacillus pueri]GGH77373.1 cytochrome c oxidase assembly factor CtaG [Pullulanibacillus pueri]
MDTMNHEPFWSLGFFELWNPIMVIILLMLGWLYVKSVLSKEGKLSKSKTFFLVSGLVLFYIAEGSPLHAFGHHYLFTAHMMCMSIAYFMVPPLILLGLHTWMVDPLLNMTFIRKTLKFFSNPILGVLSFNLLLSFYHIPVIFNFIMSQGWRMTLANVILIIFSFIMWWLVFPPTERNTRVLTQFQKLGYVFAASVVLTPACAMIMFSNHVMYNTIAHEPQVISFLPALQDQNSGGVIMKIMQEIVFVCVLAHVVYSWAKSERDPEQDDLNPKSNNIDLLQP